MTGHPVRALRALLLATAFSLLGSAGAAAQPVVAPPTSLDDVPAELRPWVGWVLDGEPSYGCTWKRGEPHCVFPGELRLEVSASSLRFTLAVTADRQVRVPLPGGGSHFPREVRLGGRAIPVLQLPDGAPYVVVPAGSHRLEGDLRFAERPELLAVPPDVARVQLIVDGVRIALPRREEDGRVWLEGSREGRLAEGTLEVDVHRKLEDGVPFRVTTRIVLRASGAPREVELGGALLEGAMPVEIRAELPVRMTPAGTLRAQAKAGAFTIEMVTLHPAPPESLAATRAEAPWPAEEVWVWASDAVFREAKLGGVPSIDAARTTLPDDWRSLPAYLVEAGKSLTIETLRRGEPSPPPNRLRVDRELWLDLDGVGYTVRDRISGTMAQEHRLDLEEGTLGRASLAGRDQLVTTHDGKTGVEIRASQLDLLTEWRLDDARGDLPAVGWSDDVEQLSARLNLPPGYSLFAVRGVDRAPDTWLARWDLWGIFFVLVVSIAVGRLAGAGFGVVALFALALSYHEPDAPIFAWVFVIAFLALHVALPEGWLRRLATMSFALSAAVLLVIVVPFSIEQLKRALYPSADLRVSYSSPPPNWGSADEVFSGGGVDEEGAMGMSSPKQFEPEPPVPSAPTRGRREMPKKYANDVRLDPDAVVQTGPGVPDFHFRQSELSFSGPVTRDHRITLYLLGPWTNRALAVSRVLLLFLLVFALFRRRPRPSAGEGAGRPPRRERNAPEGAFSEPPSAPVARVALPLFALALFCTSPVRADAPEPSRLEELKTRLLRAPECTPQCAVASEVVVRIEGTRVIVDATVSAGARAAWPLPGPVKSFVPESVTVDGSPSQALALLDGGFVFVRLEPGVHRLRLEGPIPLRDSLTLAFAEPPRSVRVEAPDWDVEGARADLGPTSSLRLRRRIASTESAAPEVELPEWLIVHRHLDVGVRWSMVTTVERITPAGKPVVARFPLLPGEAVADEHLPVEGGAVVVTLARDENEKTFRSVLEPRADLTLKAADGVRWSERWTMACSPIYRCAPEGVPPSTRDREGRWEPTYRPFPGETLRIAFEKPAPAEGRSITLDSAPLDLHPGVRLLRGELHLQVRSSHGGTQRLTLPADARVTALVVGGEERAVASAENVLSIALRPGASDVRVEWQQPIGIQTRFVAPSIHLGSDAVNARVRIHVPEDRWLLFAGGPAWGTAILFWPYLLLVLVVAFALARTRRTPLGFWQWSLLGLGLTQIPAWFALAVVAWFFAIAHRERTPHLHPVAFDLRQFGLAVLTLFALGCLYAAVHVGLLMQPDMQVITAEGFGPPAWYQDRIDGAMPEPWVVSLPLWVYRVAMLLWALWLAWRLVHWLGWAFRAFTLGGIWQGLRSAPRDAR